MDGNHPRSQEWLDASRVPKRFLHARFENFEAPAGSPQADALAAAQTISASIAAGESSAGGIFIGEIGTGKTHLACAIIHEACRTTNALFTTTQRIIRTVKDGWSERVGEATSLQLFQKVGLLVVDEVGVQFGSDTEKLYLTELVNDRYNAMKPTLLISNMSADELRDSLGARVLDRFNENGVTVVFHGNSYRRQAGTPTARKGKE